QYNADLIFRREVPRRRGRMFFTTCVAGSFSGIDFCLMSADGGHANPGEHSVATSLAANAI
ncbi:MAG: hypothetical protein WAN68_18560, partial [Pseudolabrys sp.]